MKTVKPLIFLCAGLALTGCSKRENSEGTTRPPGISLHAAAMQGNVNAVRQHMEAGSDLDAEDAYGSSPLTVAATFGQTEVARILIEGGADLETTNNDGSTPLHVAAFLCRTEIVQLLLDHGANREARAHAGHTALESVSIPFEAAKPIYDAIAQGLRPLGLRLDYEHIQATRPIIAEMLRG
jgi:ankyrin repeat protein